MFLPPRKLNLLLMYGDNWPIVINVKLQKVISFEIIIVSYESKLEWLLKLNSLIVSLSVLQNKTYTIWTGFKTKGCI